MVRDYGPGKAMSFRVGENCAKAFKKLDAVGVILENLFPFDAPDNDMMKSPWSIDSRFAWHVPFLSEIDTECKKLIM